MCEPHWSYSTYKTTSCPIDSEFEQIDEAQKLIHSSVKSIKDHYWRELTMRDREIREQRKTIERLQSEKNHLALENARYKSKDEDQFNGLINTNTCLEQEVNRLRSVNVELRAKLAQTAEEKASLKERTAFLESEKDKANHIIKNLIQKKIPNQQQANQYPLRRSPILHNTKAHTVVANGPAGTCHIGDSGYVGDLNPNGLYT